MINIRPLIEQRLRNEVADFKEVAGAADLVSVLKGRLADRGCYVLQEAESAGKNPLIGAVMQENVEHYAIIIVVRNVRDARGTDAADACHALRASAKDALLGWIPDDSCGALEKVSGKLVNFMDGFFIWKDSYQTYQFIRSI